MTTTCELWYFMMRMLDYEPGIVEHIKYFIKTYTFKTNVELYNAVKQLYSHQEQMWW